MNIKNTILKHPIFNNAHLIYAQLEYVPIKYNHDAAAITDLRIYNLHLQFKILIIFHN